MFKLPLLVLTTAWLLLGCLTGERLSTRKTIYLSLAEKNASAGNKSTETAALALIDSVLTKRGFVREIAPPGTATGLVAQYGKIGNDGLRMAGTPMIYVRNGNLEFILVELGNRTGRLKHSRELLNTMEKRLRTQFGSDKVRRG